MKKTILYTLLSATIIATNPLYASAVGSSAEIPIQMHSYLSVEDLAAFYPNNKNGQIDACKDVSCATQAMKAIAVMRQCWNMEDTIELKKFASRHERSLEYDFTCLFQGSREDDNYMGKINQQLRALFTFPTKIKELSPTGDLIKDINDARDSYLISLANAHFNNIFLARMISEESHRRIRNDELLDFLRPLKEQIDSITEQAVSHETTMEELLRLVSENDLIIRSIGEKFKIISIMKRGSE